MAEGTWTWLVSVLHASIDYMFTVHRVDLAPSSEFEGAADITTQTRSMHRPARCGHTTDNGMWYPLSLTVDAPLGSVYICDTCWETRTPA